MKNVIWIAALCALLGVAGCAGDQTATPQLEQTGSLSMLLELANGETIDEVGYVITRTGMEPMEGVIDTSAPGATASVEVFGLEPGDGYLITMTAESTDGSTTCGGDADFAVTVGEATEVMVVLNCKGPTRFGSVRVNGEINICAELTKMVAAPLQTSVGNPIELSAAGDDAEGDVVVVRWTAEGGELATTEGGVNELTCTEAGEGSVAAEVSDDGFDVCVSGWTIAVTCVDDGGGSGGSGGAGGEAGAGGEGGDGGEAGAGGEPCTTPSPPVFAEIVAGATLRFDEGPTEVGTSTDPNALEPESWTETDEYTFPSTSQSIKVFARFVGAECELAHVYEVVDAYAPEAGEPGSTAIDRESTEFVAWAGGFVEPVDYGTEVDEEFRTPDNAVGPSTGDGSDVVSLGNGGSITMTFTTPIANGDGFDFAVFENSFADFNFLELGFVEVSSDGLSFARFPSSYLGTTPLGPFDLIDSPSIMEGLASKYWVGQGTPFDLDTLRFDPLVQDGTLDLNAVTHVRIVDIIGDGSATDSFGNVIYDPTPTTGSAGVDLEAIGVLNQAE